MRIIHVIEYFQPTIGYQETFLALEHQKLGHEVYIITSDRYSNELFKNLKPLLQNRIVGVGKFNEEDLKVHRLKSFFEFQHGTYLINLEKELIELNPDLVIVHGVANFSALRIAKLKTKYNKFKLIFDDHMTNENSNSIYRILYPLFKKCFLKLIINTVDSFIAITPSTKIFMNNKYGIPINKIQFIPLGADISRFKYDSLSRIEIRNELSLSKKDVLFIYAGKIIPSKKIEILIKALIQLEKYPELKILLLGNGSTKYIAFLKKLINDNNIGNKVIWYDFVKNKYLYKYFSASDVAIWPSGASAGQVEAMSCRLPIIISVKSVTNYLIDYNNGFLYRENDVHDLSQKIIQLLDPKIRTKMGLNSEKYIIEKLNWKIIAQNFIESVYN